MLTRAAHRQAAERALALGATRAAHAHLMRALETGRDDPLRALLKLQTTPPLKRDARFISELDKLEEALGLLGELELLIGAKLLRLELLRSQRRGAEAYVLSRQLLKLAAKLSDIWARTELEAKIIRLSARR